jgi:hypothetical protein
MPPLDVVFSSHARRRMRQRRVREQDVLIALEHPHETKLTDEPSSLHLRTFFDGRTLKVWVRVPIVGTTRFVNSTAWKDE